MAKTEITKEQFTAYVRVQKSGVTNIMSEIKNSPNQERVVFGPNVKQPQQQGYVNPDTGRSV